MNSSPFDLYSSVYIYVYPTDQHTLFVLEILYTSVVVYSVCSYSRTRVCYVLHAVQLVSIYSHRYSTAQYLYLSYTLGSLALVSCVLETSLVGSNAV